MKKVFLFVCFCIVLCVPCFAGSFGPYVHVTKPNTQYSIGISGSGNVDFFIRPNNIGQQYVYSISTANNGTISFVGTTSNGQEVDDSYSNWTQKAVIGSDTIYEGSNFSWSYDENAVLTGPTPFSWDTSNADIYAQYVGFLEDNPYPRPGTSDPNYPGNNPGDTPGPSSSFRVPAGNVLYFQVDSEQDVILDANMPKLSSFLFGGNPWGDSGIRYGPAASLPSSSTTFPILSQDAVSWSVKQPTNVLGQSRVGTSTKRCIVGQWYALYLPSIFGLLDTTTDLDSSRYLPGASVDISGSFSNIKVYPLESQYNWSGADFVTGSADDYETYYDGSVDENGSVTFTNQDGVVSTPPNGGSNQFDVDTNPLNLVETIKNILSNILKEIESLFTFGYDAIRSLVGIMSDFVSVFSGLYSWLPHPVYSALISAITIAIVIGVFKVFL